MSFAGLTVPQMLTLFGSLAGGVLLLYLLKLRRRRVRVPFGPLWSRVVKEQRATSLFSRLKRLVSFFVQLAILACIVLALGAPELSGLSGCNAEQVPEPPERHTLIVLDASASMGAVDGTTNRLEMARRKAREVIENVVANPNHRAMVVQLDQKLSPLSLWTRDSDALQAALKAYAPGGPVDTPTGIRKALPQLLSMTQGRTGVQTVLISDQAFQTIPKPTVESLNLKTIDVGGQGINVGFESFNVRPSLDDSLSYTVFYGVQNESDERLKARITLYAVEDGHSTSQFMQDENLVSSHPIELTPRQRTTGLLENIHFPGSRLLAHVELHDEHVRDILGADDLAFALVPERRKLKVQLVSSGNLFLHASLFVRENIDFEEVAASDYQGASGHDVTIVDSVAVDMSQPERISCSTPNPEGLSTFKATLRNPVWGK